MTFQKKERIETENVVYDFALLIVYMEWGWVRGTDACILYDKSKEKRNRGKQIKNNWFLRSFTSQLTVGIETVSIMTIIST